MPLTITYPLVPADAAAQLTRDSAVALSAFGLGRGMERMHTLLDLTDEFRFDHPGIVAITGHSGSGKTSLLKILKEFLYFNDEDNDVLFRTDIPIIQTWPVPAVEAIERLSAAGLADPFSWCRTYVQLSEGQKARFRAVAALYASNDIVILDEFLTGIDPLTSRSTAWTFQRTARRLRRRVIIATTNPAALIDLDPDILITATGTKTTHLTRRTNEKKTCSILDELRVERSKPADWPVLRPLHYASGDPCAVRFSFTARDPLSGSAAAVVIYTAPPLQSRARNIATANDYQIPGPPGQAVRINKDILLLARIVVAPPWRGAGVARWLIQNTMPLTGAKWIECTTAMSRYTPFLASAGFIEVPQHDRLIDEKLHAWADREQLPPLAILDPVTLAGYVESLSKRRRDNARQIIWRYFHHYIQNRAEHKRSISRIPNPEDPRWPEAFSYAGTRLFARPGYWIAGPFDAPIQPAL